MRFEDIRGETAEIVVRPAMPGDYAAFVAGYAGCGPAKNRFDEGGFDTSFMTKGWYRDLLDRRAREAAADYCYLFHIFRREDGAALGYCDITTQFREDFQYAKIGYTIHNPYWGRGYATECVGLLVKIGFEQLSFHRLEAHFNLDNPASKAVLRKNGFQFECVRKGFILEDGAWTDNEIYYLNDPDWRAPGTERAETGQCGTKHTEMPGRLEC